MKFLNKRYLFTPGPVPVAPLVLLTQAQPMTHHRLPEFSLLLREIRQGLKYLFQTQERVYFFTSSGTGAMEAAITNLFSPGDKVIVVEGGKFGERWKEISIAYGLEVVSVVVPWGKAVDPEDVERTLRKNPESKAILVQACETSTGVKHPVAELASLCKSRETILVVDGITAVGVYPLPMDELGIDVLITGSQKAMSLPPGLSFIALSPKAKALAKRSTLPKYYFSLQKEDKAYDKDTTAFTPAVSLLLALREMLVRIRELSLTKLHLHHRALSVACQRAILALGLDLFPEVPAESLTVIKSPDGLDTGVFLKFLRDRWGILFAGGQDQLKGKIIRITHMGDQSPFDLLVGISALELGLKHFGLPVEIGKGVKTAEEELYSYLSTL